jgi:hypothetical protein
MVEVVHDVQDDIFYVSRGSIEAAAQEGAGDSTARIDASAVSYMI